MPWFLPGSENSPSRQDESPTTRAGSVTQSTPINLSSRFGDLPVSTPKRGSVSSGKGLPSSAKDSPARVHFGIADGSRPGSPAPAPHQNSDKQHRILADRGALSPEVLKLSQQYHNLLNKPLPPPPEGGGPGCQDSCCWRWLTAMLLQEMQVLRKALAESREAFVEQERNFAGLDEPPDESGMKDLLKQYGEVKAEHDLLRSQAPQLREANRDLREAVQQRRQEVLAVEAKVDKLSEMQGMEHTKCKELEDRLTFLQKSFLEDEDKERRVKETEMSAQSMLRIKMQHIQVVSDDHHALLLRRDLMQAGARSKARLKKGNSPTGSSSPKRSSQRASGRSFRNSTVQALAPTAGDASPSQLPTLSEPQEAAPVAADSAARAAAPEAQQLDEAGRTSEPVSDVGAATMPMSGHWGDDTLSRKDRKSIRQASKSRGSTPS